MYARPACASFLFLLLAAPALAGLANAAAPTGSPVLSGPGAGSAPGTLLGTLTPTLSWSPVAGATDYRVYVSKDPYGEANLVMSQGDVAGTSYVVPTGKLAADTKYRWNVRPYNGSEMGSISNTLYFQTGTLPPRPESIGPGGSTEVGAVAVGGTFTLEWSPVAGAQAYGVAISKKPYGSANVIFERDGLTTTSLTLTRAQLPADHSQYRWDVVAVNGIGMSAPSADRYFTAPLNRAPTCQSSQPPNGEMNVIVGDRVRLTARCSDEDGNWGSIAWFEGSTPLRQDPVPAGASFQDSELFYSPSSPGQRSVSVGASDAALSTSNFISWTINGIPSPTPAPGPTTRPEGDGAPAPTPTPSPSPSPRPPANGSGSANTYVFGASVPMTDRTQITTLADRARAASRERFAMDPPVTIFAYETGDEVADAYIAHEGLTPPASDVRERWTTWGSGETTPSAIYLKLGPDWDAREEGGRFALLAGMYSSALQWHLSGPGAPRPSADETPTVGPYWLTTGGATLMSVILYQDEGYACYETEYREATRRAGRDPIDLALLETYPGFERIGTDRAYALSFLAADWLAAKHTIDSQLAFHANVRTIQPWQTAFEAAFGETPAAFSADFSSRLANGAFPERGLALAAGCSTTPVAPTSSAPARISVNKAASVASADGLFRAIDLTARNVGGSEGGADVELVEMTSGTTLGRARIDAAPGATVTTRVELALPLPAGVPIRVLVDGKEDLITRTQEATPTPGEAPVPGGFALVSVAALGVAAIVRLQRRRGA